MDYRLLSLFQFYNVTNHVATSDNLQHIGENIFHDFLVSEIYRNQTGNCVNENNNCNEYSGVCHYQSPDLMMTANKKLQNST